MKAAIYLRVSTDRQRDEGLSLDMQRQKCEQRARADGAQGTIEVFEDGDFSGRKADNRTPWPWPWPLAARPGKGSGTTRGRQPRGLAAPTRQGRAARRPVERPQRDRGRATWAGGGSDDRGFGWGTAPPARAGPRPNQTVDVTVAAGRDNRRGSTRWLSC